MIEGSLRGLALDQLIQILAQGRKTGTLALVDGDRSARIVLVDGRIDVATIAPGSHVGDMLVREGLASSLDVQRALDEQERTSRAKRLGEIVVEMGLVPRDAIQRILRLQATETLADVVDWTDGEFSFTEHVADARPTVTAAFDVTETLMAAAVLRDAWNEGSVPPSATLARRPRSVDTVASLDDEARTLLATVDGRRSARGLANASPLGERKALAVLYRLERAGFVERIPSDGPEPRAVVVARDEARQALIRLTLSRMGFWTIAMVPSLDAVPTLRAVQPAVAVVDDEQGDGLTWLRQVRTVGRGTRVPVVVVTGDAGSVGWWTRMRLGIEAVVPRPFDDMALSQAIANVTSK